jgi:hypothetical protein
MNYGCQCVEFYVKKLGNLYFAIGNLDVFVVSGFLTPILTSCISRKKSFGFRSDFFTFLTRKAENTEKPV